MSLIRTEKYYPSRQSSTRPLLLMCGFGGSVWQLRRLVVVLNEAGYDVTAIDFPKTVLSRGDVALLPKLVEEVVDFADKLVKSKQEPVQLVGISLGALLALNIVRRSSLFQSAVLITGGDIAKIAKRLYPKAWAQPYTELAHAWNAINMYSDPPELRGKRLIFVLHPSSKLIDVSDAHAEIARQAAAGNEIQLVERNRYDHIGTIIEETILHPKRTLGYIQQVEAVGK